MKNHGGNGAFKCSVCNFTADIKQSLTVHEMNHHIPPLANSMDIERTIDDTPPENINIFDMVSIYQEAHGAGYSLPHFDMYPMN
jgi:hypothetical protein